MLLERMKYEAIRYEQIHFRGTQIILQTNKVRYLAACRIGIVREHLFSRYSVSSILRNISTFQGKLTFF
jgi:hypothetical protein